MEIDEYQERAHSFATYPMCYVQTKEDQLLNNIPWAYPALKLSGEVGEVNEKLGKIIRDKDGYVHSDSKDAIKKELGDVVWYIAELCTVLDLKLSDVLETNIAKLDDRRARNVIGGSGDNR